MHVLTANVGPQLFVLVFSWCIVTGMYSFRMYTASCTSEQICGGEKPTSDEAMIMYQGIALLSTDVVLSV